jgi:phosphoadenosine phosphosulfate reductase
MTIDLDAVNAELKDKSPEAIVRWATGLDKRVMATTSFSPNAAAMLHLIQGIAPDIPVVWVDSGYNMADAYLVAQEIIERLGLNMHIYIPEMTAERRNALMGGIPHPEDDPDLHREFTRQVKLEPFQRALDDLKPQVWLTGIRANETAFRQTLDTVTWDERGLLRVAPFFHWSEAQVEEYMNRYELPSCRHYFDPTKAAPDVECGLHTTG